MPAGARFDPANIDPTTGSVLQDAFLRPIPNFEEVEERTRDGVIDYDSLQVTLNRRVANGVGWGLSYTLSTTKDMQGNLTVFLDPRERLYDYANNDRRHILSYHASWDLPDGSRMWQNPVTRALLDGWQLAGVGYFMSGTPDDVTFQTTDAGGTDTIGGGDPVRITMTCDPHLPRSQRSEDRWFDTSCFARTPMGDYGNAPRQMIRQPGDWNLDLSLAKAFAMGGSRKFSVRAEAYNVLNLEDRTVNTTATFDPDGNQVNSDFGRLNLPTGEARVVQLSLRFEF